MQSRLDLQSEEIQKKVEEMTEMAERIDLLLTQKDDIDRLFRDTQRMLEMESRSKELAQTRSVPLSLVVVVAVVVVVVVSNSGLIEQKTP